MKLAPIQILFFLVISVAYCNAAETAGSIVKTTGKVYCYRSSSPKPHPVAETPFSVDFGDQVQTRRNSGAHLRFSGGSKFVLEELSSLRLHERNELVAEEGTILFDIKTAGQAKGITVTSAAVTIGVKGTRFAVVRFSDAAAIFLKAGQLKLRSNTPEAMFRLQGELKDDYRENLKQLKNNFDKAQQEMAEKHSAMTDKMQKMFESNRAKMQQGNLTEVAEFDLQSGMAVLIDGQNLFNIEFSDEWEGKFSQLDSF